MLNRKLYKCRECGKEVPILSKGLCPYCRSKELPKKEKKPIRCRPKKKNEEDNYSYFFFKHLDMLSQRPVSMLSGLAIHSPSTCNICHILPKRKYKSVAKEDLNILYLTQEEHTRFDYLLDTLDFDRLEKEFKHIFNLSIIRVQIMSLEGKIQERGKLLDKFESYFDKIEKQ